jgi:SET domain-containing protein
MSLTVKTSQLPGAGKGLYTNKPIKKATKIIEYKGEIINWKEYEKRVKEDKDGYLFYVNKNHCIDAYATPNYKARYANDAMGLSRVKGLKNNASYQVFGNKCFIVAERDIEAGEEIFVDYTQEYWECIRYNIKHNLYKTKK